MGPYWKSRLKRITATVIAIAATAICIPPSEPWAQAPPTDFRKELDRYPVIFLPGAGGSKLSKDGKEIWGSLVKTLGNLDELALPIPYARDDLVASRVMDDFVILGPIKSEQYSVLIDYYTNTLGYELGRNFFMFPYDWRQPVEDSADRLNEAVKMWRERNFRIGSAKIILLTHSMGGLVAKSYIARHQKYDEVARLIFMGAPHLGLFEVFQLIVEGAYGPYSGKVRRAAFTFPGFFELLPVHWLKFAKEMRSGSYLDVYDPSVWRKNGWIPPDVPEPVALAHLQDMLGRAKRFQESLKDFPAMPEMVTFFGYGNRTPFEYQVFPGGKLDLRYSLNGDSRVTFSSAVPYRGIPDFETHPIVKKHGSMYGDSSLLTWLSYETSRLFEPKIGDIFRALSGPPPIPSPNKESILRALNGIQFEGIFLDTQLTGDQYPAGKLISILGALSIPSTYGLGSAQLSADLGGSIAPMRPVSESEATRAYLRNLEYKKEDRRLHFFEGVIPAPESPGRYRIRTNAIFVVDDLINKGAFLRVERTMEDYIEVVP